MTTDGLTIQTRKRADQVRDHMLGLIQAGTWQAGQTLPTERELMDMFGVGRSSIRDAVQSLSGLGILESRQGYGVFVKRASIDDVRRIVSGALMLTQKAALQVVEAREVIELGAAKLAAERRTSEDLAEMSRAIDLTRVALEDSDVDMLVDSDISFHAAIMRAAGNDVLCTMLDSIAHILREHRRQTISRVKNRSVVLDAHQGIYHAILASDPVRAAELTERHYHILKHQIATDLASSTELEFDQQMTSEAVEE